MRTAKEVLVCLLLILACALACAGIAFITTATEEVKGLKPAVLARVDQATSMTAAIALYGVFRADSQITDTRKVLMGEFRETRKQALEALNGIRQDANHRIVEFNGTLSTQLAGIRTDLKPALDSANVALHAVPDNLIPALQHTAAITAKIDDNLPLWTDCDHNPSCAYNLFQGTAKAIQRMTQSGAKAAPEITENVAAMSADGRKITHRMASPLSFALDVFKKIKGWIF